MNQSSNNAIGDMVKRIRSRELTGDRTITKILKDARHNKHPIKKMLKIVSSNPDHNNDAYSNIFREINTFLDIAELPINRFKLYKQIADNFTFGELRAYIHGNTHNPRIVENMERDIFPNKIKDLDYIRVGLNEKIAQLKRMNRENKFTPTKFEPIAKSEIDSFKATDIEKHQKHIKATKHANTNNPDKGTRRNVDELIDSYEYLFGIIEGEMEIEEIEGYANEVYYGRDEYDQETDDEGDDD